MIHEIDNRNYIFIKTVKDANDADIGKILMINMNMISMTNIVELTHLSCQAMDKDNDFTHLINI